MKKLFCFILICVLSAAVLLIYGCDKPNNPGSGSGSESSSETDSSAPVIIIPEYNVTVNVIKKEYGSDNGTVAEIIERSSSAVYGLKAVSENSVTFGSAVAVFEGEINEAAENTEAADNARYCTFLVTCLSVLRGADEYILFGSDGTEFSAAFIGADPKTNIAVLSVYERLPVAEFIDDSEKIRLGDEMFAVGFPFNAGAGVVKMTTLGAKSHDVNDGAEVRNLMVLSDNLSAGYVGGAAYAVNGGAIGGIITALDGVKTEGYSFIIPANAVLEAARELVETYTPDSYGYITGNYYLGATYEDSKMTSLKYVYISEIDQAGCLYQGGLRAGDRITRVEYIPKGSDAYSAVTEVESKEELEKFLRSLKDLKIGDRLSFRFVRDKLVQTRTVTVSQYVYGNAAVTESV